VITAQAEGCDPGRFKPVGVGSAALGMLFLGLNVMVPQYLAPVDAYLMIYVPELDPANFYLIGPDNALRPLSAGLVAWREGLTAGAFEWPRQSYGGFGLPIPPGTYYFGLIVASEGSNLSGPYHFWVTNVTVR
jgi:hypothetical protein